MNIVVLVGGHEHAASGRAVINRNDAVAASLALGVPGAGVRLLCAGALPDEVARGYLALGAPRIDILETASHDVVAPLAEASRDSALVLTGLRAGGGLGSGVLPHAVAERLQRPLLVDVIAIEPQAEGWRITQALPRGARRLWRVDAPAVLAVHPNAPVALRHSWRDAQAGEVQRRRIDARNDDESPWTLVPAARQLQRLRAAREQSGHSRMLGAISAEQERSAATVLIEGSADDKARAIHDYLRAHALLPPST